MKCKKALQEARGDMFPEGGGYVSDVEPKVVHCSGLRSTAGLSVHSPWRTLLCTAGTPGRDRRSKQLARAQTPQAHEFLEGRTCCEATVAT